MKATILFVIMTLSHIVHAQEYSYGGVLVYYDIDSNFHNSTSNEILITLHSGFEDSLKVYVNGKLIGEDFCVSGKAVNKTKCEYRVKLCKKKDYLLTIKSITEKKIFSLALDRRFLALRLSKSIYDDDAADWFATYSNNILALE